MRKPIVFISALLLGCTPVSSGAGPSPERQIVSIATEYGTIDVERYIDSRGSSHVLPASPASLWPRLVQAYSDMEIPLSTIDSGSRTIGNAKLIGNRTLGGQPLSRYFSCGSTATGAAVADNYRMEIYLVSVLHGAEGEHSRLETHARATAFPRGPSSTPVQCATRGALEEHLVRRIVLQLARD